MINQYDILETIRMIQDECLDIRTITMGISLLDCIDPDIDKACKKVYDRRADRERIRHTDNQQAYIRNADSYNLGSLQVLARAFR